MSAAIECERPRAHRRTAAAAAAVHEAALAETLARIAAPVRRSRADDVAEMRRRVAEIQELADALRAACVSALR